MMKISILWIVLPIVFLGLSCSNNSNDDLIDLEVEQNVYSLFLTEGKVIPIIGNGRYEIVVSNSAILNAEYKENENGILLSPLSIGRTSLTITDIRSKQEKEVTIIIIKSSAYLSLKVYDTSIGVDIDEESYKVEIQNSITAEQDYLVDSYISLISLSNEVYIFDSEEDLESGRFRKKGSYQIIENAESAILEFTFDTEKFDYTLDIQSHNSIKYFLVSNITFIPQPFYAHLGNELTNQYSGTYPELQKAVIIFKCVCVPSFIMELPPELL